MNKLRLLSFLFAALIIASVSGCKKDDDAEPTQKALLTAKVWQGNRIFIDNDDFTSFADMDNSSLQFNSNGTYLTKLAGNANNGTWELTANDQKLLMDKGTNGEDTMDIIKLTSTNLTIKWTEEDPETGEEYTVEWRLVHD